MPLIRGAPLAAAIEEEVRRGVEALTAKGLRPRLVAVKAGDDPASELYLKRQAKSAERLGLRYDVEDCQAHAGVSDVLATLARLNAAQDVTGIIVQLPLPAGIDVATVQRHLDPRKDVEGVHPANLGELLDANPALPPCTAAAIVECQRATGIPVAGLDAVVIGRSRIVGRPVALMLTARDATVTVCHRGTRDLAAHTARADLVVLAAGKAGMLTPAMVKPGCTVIDVGINEVERDGKRGITGDADPAIADVAGWFTPTPGGVGPVTVALLWRNAVAAARMQTG
jgi:methylenetetrahydrofolate dehydrogenase (NADP+) / methenyltetrahydrofolate cyclohydrolase